MSQWIDLDTPHGPVRAWRADPQGDPEGAPRGAVIVVQEIWGLDQHIRNVTDRFAAAGFVALAPAVFDLVERDVELPHDQESYPRARAIADTLGFDRAVDVLSAAATLLQGEDLQTGVVGFCWGGTLAFLCNTRLGLPAVDYYGARSAPFLSESARAPLMCHFGDRDGSIPPATVALHREQHPNAEIYTYPAGHAFNRDGDLHSYDHASASQAWHRTIGFFAENLQ